MVGDGRLSMGRSAGWLALTLLRLDSEDESSMSSAVLRRRRRSQLAELLDRRPAQRAERDRSRCAGGADRQHDQAAQICPRAP